MKKVSVIIPMYNAENTIEECLKSLTGQTIFDDMELIIVDDRSDDYSVEKAAAFENKYPDNIVIVKLSENGGPGRARNIAMEYASGEYIGFVDSDDAVVPVMYEHLYDEAKKAAADVVDGGIYDQTSDEAIIYTSDDLTGEPDDGKISKLIVSGGYICSKIFRRDFLLSEKIIFREEYILEDMDYLMEVFCRMRILSNVKEIMYVYRNSSGSLSKTVEIDKYLRSTVSAMKAIHEKLSILPNYEGIRTAVEYALLQLYSYSININLKALLDGYRSEEEILNKLTELKMMKAGIVKGDYSNPYVRNKIKEADIGIMIQNDRSPADLLFIGGRSK